MKDIEKIKSEDLGCQVQDANPGNFAIEQEVAAMVGATVPAPTVPSADDARELGAQLLVFLRRALTPIQTALRTALAAIYAHLDSRCTAYTPAAYDPFRLPAGPYDPMRPFVPRTLPNLLTALTAFSARKISNGSNDGIADGISLIHLLNTGSSVTEITDDNIWEAMYGTSESARYLPGLSTFPNARKVTIGLTKTNYRISLQNAEEVYLPVLTQIVSQWLENQNTGFINAPNAKVYADALTSATYGGNYGANLTFLANCKELYIRGISDLRVRIAGVGNITNPIEKVVMDKIDYFYEHPTSSQSSYMNFYNCPNLIHLEFGNLGGTVNCSISLAGWNPTNVLSDQDKTATFLQNFREHIALRLAQQPADNPNHLTLTLSQAVFSAVIEGTDPICDEIKGIIEDKGWKVQDTNNNIFPTT